jgi:hypothetical protein
MGQDRTGQDRTGQMYSRESSEGGGGMRVKEDAEWCWAWAEWDRVRSCVNDRGRDSERGNTSISYVCMSTSS